MFRNGKTPVPFHYRTFGLPLNTIPVFYTEEREKLVFIYLTGMAYPSHLQKYQFGSNLTNRMQVKSGKNGFCKKL